MLRRNFLGGLLAAPAIVKASSLMPLRYHRGGIATLPGCGSIWTHMRVQSNESYDPRVFDEFVRMQIEQIAQSLGAPYERLIVAAPNIQVQYSGARVALLEQFPKPRPSGQWTQGQSRPFPS